MLSFNSLKTRLFHIELSNYYRVIRRGCLLDCFHAPIHYFLNVNWSALELGSFLCSLETFMYLGITFNLNISEHIV